MEVGAVGDHGGSLGRATRLFPQAPLPWVDLSTGINPHSYPHTQVSATALTRLPEPDHEARLRAAAARAWGIAEADCIASAPGTQILLPLVMELVAPGQAAVLSPTYAEHARAARIAGHKVVETDALETLAAADIAIIVNPNNPDGRVISRGELAELARHMARRGGLLVVDEAFMDVGPRDESAVALVEELPVIILKSFGKFFGLAGVRLGFAVASRGVAGRLSARLGPWAVSGPALEIGTRALADHEWQDAMRAKLAAEAARLDVLLAAHGVDVAVGTSLFRFIVHPRAQDLFRALGQAGIIARVFAWRGDVLRLGLPADVTEWGRLEAALALWSTKGSSA